MGRTNKKPRWYQVRLHVALLGVTLIAVALAFWSAQVRPYLFQFELKRQVTSAGGTLEARPGPNWLQPLLGEENCQDITLLNLADAKVNDQLLQAVARLPQLEVLILGGQQINDDSLRFIPQCKSLQGVILDSTCVSQEALDRLRAARPGLHVNRCDRQAMLTWNPDVGIPMPRYAIDTITSDPPPPASLKNRLLATWFQEVTAIVRTESQAGSPPAKRTAVDTLQTMHRLHTLKIQVGSMIYAGGLTQHDLDTIGSLRQLRRLSLSDDEQVVSRYTPQIDFSPLAQLTGLSELSLRGLPITDTDMQSLAPLTKLRKLDLSYTHVTDPSAWPLFPITALNLEDTFLQDDDMSALTRYQTLESLALSFTELTDEGLVELLPLEGITSLRMAGTRMTEASYETLCGFPKLEYVAIGSVPGVELSYANSFLGPVRIGSTQWYTPFGPDDLDGGEFYGKDDIPFIQFQREEFAPIELDYSTMANDAKLMSAYLQFGFAGDSLHLDLLENLSGVKTLDLSQSFACDDDMRYLASMPELEYLDLTDTWVTDAGLMALANCKRLKGLKLSGSRVTDAGMRHLAQIQTLEEVELPAQAVRGEGCQQLAKLPRLQFFSFSKAWLRTSRQRLSPGLTKDDAQELTALTRIVFNRYDTDKDGVVSREEHQRLWGRFVNSNMPYWLGNGDADTLGHALQDFEGILRLAPEAGAWLEDTYEIPAHGGYWR